MITCPTFSLESKKKEKVKEKKEKKDKKDRNGVSKKEKGRPHVSKIPSLSRTGKPASIIVDVPSADETVEAIVIGKRGCSSLVFGCLVVNVIVTSTTNNAVFRVHLDTNYP